MPVDPLSRFMAAVLEVAVPIMLTIGVFGVLVIMCNAAVEVVLALWRLCKLWRRS